MIEKIKITNFKSIEELELDLGRVNVLIGENGCGKTNILEGIGFAGSNTLGRGFHSIGGRSTEDTWYLSKTTKYPSDEILLTIADHKEKFSWVSRYDHHFRTLIHYHVYEGMRFPVGYHGPTELSGRTRNDYGIAYIDLTSALINSYLITAYRSYSIFCPENTFLRRFEDEGQVEPLGIRGEGLFKELQKIIKNHPKKFKEIKEALKAIDWFEDLEIPEDLFIYEKRIRLKDRYLGSNPDVQFLDQRSANEGFLFLLFYFTLFVSDDTPKFFAIDNIDQALNPLLCIKLMQTLTEMAKKHEKQVIFTTHNPAILDGLDLEDEKKDQRLFVVYRNAYGNTVAKRHSRKEGLKGVDPPRLSEGFIRGYIGGLPKNIEL